MITVETLLKKLLSKHILDRLDTSTTKHSFFKNNKYIAISCLSISHLEQWVFLIRKDNLEFTLLLQYNHISKDKNNNIIKIDKIFHPIVRFGSKIYDNILIVNSISDKYIHTHIHSSIFNSKNKVIKSFIASKQNYDYTNLNSIIINFKDKDMSFNLPMVDDIEKIVVFKDNIEIIKKE